MDAPQARGRDLRRDRRRGARGPRSGNWSVGDQARRKPVAAGPGGSGLAGRSGGRRVGVVAARRGVVRAVGVEQRGEQLDLAACDTELAHAAAVHRQAVGFAAGVDLEQLLGDRRSARASRSPRRSGIVRVVQRARAGERARRRTARRTAWGCSSSVTSGMSCGSSSSASGKHSITAVYMASICSGVPDVHAVLALEVDRPDSPGRGQLLDEGAVPHEEAGVDLETHPRGTCPRRWPNVGERGRISEAERVDVGDRPWRQAEQRRQ